MEKRVIEITYRLQVPESFKNQLGRSREIYVTSCDGEENTTPNRRNGRKRSRRVNRSRIDDDDHDNNNNDGDNDDDDDDVEEEEDYDDDDAKINLAKNLPQDQARR